MKQLMIAATAASALFVLPAVAQAAEPAMSSYAQINIGSSVAGQSKLGVNAPGVAVGSEKFDLDAGLFGSVAVGTRFATGFGVEAEVLHFKNDIDTDDADRALGAPLDAKVQVTGAMANATFSAGGPGQLLGRVGVGVGYGESKYDLLGGSDKKDGVMWQVMAGVAYPMSDRLSLDVGYRFVRAPDYDQSSPSASISAETRAHIITVGSRFAF